MQRSKQPCELADPLPRFILASSSKPPHLEPWEEPGVYQRRLTELHSWRYVPRHAEIRILLGSGGGRPDGEGGVGAHGV